MTRKDAIEEAADTHRLEPALVKALVWKESSGNPWAWNPEPSYRYLWDLRRARPFRPLSELEIASEIPPPDFPTFPGVLADAEWWGQQASWGLCQVMGAVAREHGMDVPFLTALCEPKVGLEYGCRHLRGLLDRYKGSVEQALAAYNGGPGAAAKRPFPNQGYVDYVLGKMFQVRARPER